MTFCVYAHDSTSFFLQYVIIQYYVLLGLLMSDVEIRDFALYYRIEKTNIGNRILVWLKSGTL